MTAYFLGGFILLAALLALQLRLVLRIWERLRWTHPNVHAVGALQAQRSGAKAPLAENASMASPEKPRC